MGSGTTKLAQVIAIRITTQTQRPDALELGTIQASMALLIDRFPIPIPRGEYLVCRGLTLSDPMTSTPAGQGNHPHGPSGGHTQQAGDGVHAHPGTEGTHQHAVPVPAQLAALKPGDRVLVAWTNSGIDPVIIDVVVTS